MKRVDNVRRKLEGLINRKTHIYFHVKLIMCQLQNTEKIYNLYCTILSLIQCYAIGI